VESNVGSALKNDYESIGGRFGLGPSGGALGPLPPTDWRGWKDLKSNSLKSQQPHDRTSNYWSLLYRDA
jgi:hypothetical protein